MKKLTIIVNGIETAFETEGDATLSVNDYIANVNISGRFIVVINNQVIPKSIYATTVLNDGDKLDIISPISGG